MKPPYATTEEMMALSLPALRLFGFVTRKLEDGQTDRIYIATQAALEGADILPTQIAETQLEIARSGLMWVRHGLKATRYQLTRPEQRQRRDHIMRISTVGKPRDSQTPTTSKAYESEGWSVRPEPKRN